MKKQINILKVIGYSKYVTNFINFKRSKKDYSGNIFLEMLEKYFVNSIMDKEEIDEYEKLNKVKNIDFSNEENENIDYSNENEEKYNENENKDEINDFIDLREILSEEMFKEAKKDILYKENK